MLIELSKSRHSNKRKKYITDCISLKKKKSLKNYFSKVLHEAIIIKSSFEIPAIVIFYTTSTGRFYTKTIWRYKTRGVKRFAVNINVKTTHRLGFERFMVFRERFLSSIKGLKK